MNIVDFFYTYFIDPMYTGEGYNLYNTIVYGIALGIGIVAWYKVLAKLKIEIDERLFVSLLPFLILGSSIRALEDAYIISKRAIFLTPGIFFFISLIFLIFLFAFTRITEEYHYLMVFTGIILLCFPLKKIYHNILTIKPAIYTLVMLFLISSVFILPIHKFNFLNLRDIRIYGVFLAHFLDVCATIVGVEFFGYWEEHYFEGLLVEFVGTSWILLPLKVVVLLIAVLLIRKISKNEQESNLLFLSLFILGFSPGLRDVFKMILIG